MLSPPAALFRFSRRLTGDTQRELGALLGLSSVTICRLESGAQTLTGERWKDMVPRFAIGRREADELPVHLLFEVGTDKYRLPAAAGRIGAFADWDLALVTATLLQRLSGRTVVPHPMWFDAARDQVGNAGSLVLVSDAMLGAEFPHAADQASPGTYIADLVHSMASV